MQIHLVGWSYNSKILLHYARIQVKIKVFIFTFDFEVGVPIALKSRVISFHVTI